MHKARNSPSWAGAIRTSERSSYVMAHAEETSSAGRRCRRFPPALSTEPTQPGPATKRSFHSNTKHSIRLQAEANRAALRAVEPLSIELV